MRHLTKLGLASVAAALLIAAPAGAHRGGGFHAGARAGGAVRVSAKAPSSITTRTARATRALQRAEDKADDGDTTGAATSLKSVRTNLAAALRSAKTHAVSGDAKGPAGAQAVLAAEDATVNSTAGLFDGADSDLVDATATTLEAALDGRDQLIAAIGALSDDDTAAYGRVLDRLAGNLADEAGAIAETLAGDTLTSAAKTALNAAADQIKAQTDAVTALGAGAP
jgi:hypothetical protein